MSVANFEMILEKQNGKEIIASKEKKGDLGVKSGQEDREVLSWPESSPPRCSSKCGHCTPCKSVHVSVPPGTPVIAEYYLEAWRCKCGNKVFKP
ncbi:EPIDERMAL PATTERNING FACTOR-like protein 6 [Sarracenia purpurea var. burkii]